MIQTASSNLQTFATSLIEGPSPALATEAKRLLLVQEAQELFTKRDLAKAPAIIQQAGALLAANPDDTATAGLAMQLASAFEHMPGGEALSKQAYETFGPLFQKSEEREHSANGRKFPRNTSSTFSPWQPNGNNWHPYLTENRLTKAHLLEKLFWSTSGQPGVALVLQKYQTFSRPIEKYSSQGFEVVGVSLDQDRDALEKFVTDRKIPWPILFETSEGSVGSIHLQRIME